MNNRKSQRTLIVVFVLFSIVFPFIFTSNQYLLHVMTSAFIFIIAIYGMNILAGYTGYLSLAHAGFFAIGAYSLGILTTKYEVSYWLAFVLSIIITVIIGSVLGLIALRTREHFFAIYTLVVGYLIYLVIDKWDEMTGGVRGLIGIPVPGPIGPITFDTPISMYYLVLVFMLLSILIAARIVHSLTGRTFIAIRNSEELAQTIGINTMINKMLSFVISVFFAALSGVLYASFTRFLGPEIAHLPMVFDFLMYLIVGGIGTLSGPIVGTLLITWVTQFLQGLEEYRMLVFGLLLTVIVIFYPSGLVGAYRMFKMKIQDRLRKNRDKITSSKAETNEKQLKED